MAPYDGSDPAEATVAIVNELARFVGEQTMERHDVGAHTTSELLSVAFSSRSTKGQSCRGTTSEHDEFACSDERQAEVKPTRN